jgi:hypothetical protein
MLKNLRIQQSLPLILQMKSYKSVIIYIKPTPALNKVRGLSKSLR